MEWLFLDFSVIRMDDVEMFDFTAKDGFWRIELIYKTGKKEYLGTDSSLNECKKRVKRLIGESKI